MALGLAPVTSLAQTPNSAAPTTAMNDLLQPSLGGNPGQSAALSPAGRSSAGGGNQSPPSGKFTAPSRIGATPIYGSPGGFGAGDTGFDSSNTRTAKERRRRQRNPRSRRLPASWLRRSRRRLSRRFRPQSRRGAQTASLAASTTPRPPEIYPKKSARRIGATLPPQPPPLDQTAGEQSAGRSASLRGREPRRRRRRGTAAGILRLRHRC